MFVFKEQGNYVNFPLFDHSHAYNMHNRYANSECGWVFYIVVPKLDDLAMAFAAVQLIVQLFFYDPRRSKLSKTFLKH